MRISRPIVIGLGIALVASAIFVGVATAPPIAPEPLAPVVYYEVLDAHQLSLLEQRLDGTSQPRLVADRPSTGEGLVRWEVDPSGSVALAFTLAGDGVEVEAVEIAGGRTLWRRGVERMPQPGVWSSDGRLWASNTETPEGEEGHVLVVVDVAAGTLAVSRTEQTWWPQGFTADGDLVLTEEVRNEQGYVKTWIFRLRHRVTGAVVPVNVAMAGTGPRAGSGLSDVATGAGWAVRQSLHEDPDRGTVRRLELVEFRTGKVTPIGAAEDTGYNWFALTPDASRVLALTYVEEVDGESRNALVVIDRQGEGAEVWRGPSPIGQVLSRDGRYLGLTAWVGHPALTVVHLGTGRSAEVPLPRRVVAAAIRAIVDPADVVDIAAAPLATPASVAPTPAAAPLAGAPRFIATSFESTGDGSAGLVSILAPGQGGGVAIVETMPPLELPVVDGSLWVQPRPNSDEILLEVTGNRPSRFWLWKLGEAPVELDRPAALPDDSSGARWRADGRALALRWSRTVGDSSESGVAIWEIASNDVQLIPVADPYGDLVGWAADGRRLLLRHRLCIEGCGVRLAYLAWLDPTTGKVVPFGPDDTDAGGAAHMAFRTRDGRAILLSSIELEEADDVVLRWPDDMAMPSGGWIAWIQDGRDLRVVITNEDVATLYEVRDVLARGPGRFDARPIELGRLPRGLAVQSVSPDGTWAIAMDRAYTTFLVRLETAEGWEVRPLTEGYLDWLPDR